jgi:hypothetical protein
MPLRHLVPFELSLASFRFEPHLPQTCSKHIILAVKRSRFFGVMDHFLHGTFESCEVDGLITSPNPRQNRTIKSFARSVQPLLLVLIDCCFIRNGGHVVIKSIISHPNRQAPKAKGRPVNFFLVLLPIIFSRMPQILNIDSPKFQGSFHSRLLILC